MPELPEVETTRRGIAPYLCDQKIMNVVVRDSRLRWPVTEELVDETSQQTIISVTRRGKYILINTSNGSIILHLGMSGNLRILPASATVKKHDHLDIVLANGHCLRLHDPRRFGACLWTKNDPLTHKLLASLGPEPWDNIFTATYLHHQSRNRTLAIKNFIMDSKVVVGVGNIYASEALFKSAIKPQTPAGKISLNRYKNLIESIQLILQKAIDQGGTTLRDFVNSSGQPGYFKQELAVYGKAGEPCPKCNHSINEIKIGQRSSFYCSVCQT